MHFISIPSSSSSNNTKTSTNSPYLIFLTNKTKVNSPSSSPEPIQVIKTHPVTPNTRSLFHYQQKELNCAMTNEETRSLTGVVAKTRALFETNQNRLSNNQSNQTYATPQFNPNHFKSNMKLSMSASNVNIGHKLTRSITVENDSDKENTTQSTQNISKLKSQYFQFQSQANINKPSPTTPKIIDLNFKKSFSTNRLSTSPTCDYSNQQTNVVLNKSAEASKEYNIPMSVKQAKACFESLASSNTQCQSKPMLVKAKTGLSSKSALILIPETVNSDTSSCESTPRSEETPIALTSSVSSTSSSCSLGSCTTNVSASTIKYSQQSPKFVQLYQKQMEISCVTTYRKLEDIINEADNATTEGLKQEEKKLKSILRKAPKLECETQIDPKQSVMSSSCSLSSSSCSPSSSSSSLTPKQAQLEESVKVDNTSCVLPSKLRQRTQSLQNNNDNQLPVQVSVNTSFSHCYNKTPVRNVGSYIKNAPSTSTSTSNSGLVKRVTRNATNAREALVRWSRKMTEEYDNVTITNFSSSWANGLAFCALVHHFMPSEFDYSLLDDSNPRHNFELAFKTAEEKAGVVPLLDVDDMIEMGNSPDWKCVFTYVHSLYQRFKDSV